MACNLEKLLDVIAEFETSWFMEHTSIYTDRHFDEYTKAKAEYIERNY